MKRISILVIIGCFILTGNAFSEEIILNQFEMEVEALKLGAVAENEFAESEGGQELSEFDQNSSDGFKRKSPLSAFMMSFLVPGLGQIYNGSHLGKTIGFMAVEGLAWGGHIVWHQDGLDLTDRYEAYANANWYEGDTTNFPANLDPESYRGYLNDSYGNPNDTGTGFTHSLPGTTTQQYYEMIGKYDQFAGGWEDFWDTDWDPDDPLTPMRLYYEGLRDDANNKLNQANMLIYVSILNHLFSAVDAAVSANRHNKQNEGNPAWGVKAEMYRYSALEKIPMIRVTHKF